MAQSYKSAPWGSAWWPMTSSLPLLTSTVYDLTLWLGLWRYRHPFMWVMLHHVDFSLSGCSWAQASCAVSRAVGKGPVPAAQRVRVVGAPWPHQCHTSPPIHSAWGSAVYWEWYSHSCPPTPSPFSLRKNKKHSLKDSYFGWIWGFSCFKAIALKAIVPISVCKGRSLGERKPKPYFCVTFLPAGWNNETWQIIGQYTSQSSKRFQVLTGNFKSPFVPPGQYCTAFFPPFKYLQKIFA